jgi:hypothetical protein
MQGYLQPIQKMAVLADILLGGDRYAAAIDSLAGDVNISALMLQNRLRVYKIAEDAVDKAVEDFTRRRSELANK